MVIGSVDGGLGSSKLVFSISCFSLLRRGVWWQAAVKKHQHSASHWKQGLWLFIYPNPAGLLTPCQPKWSKLEIK